MSFYNFTLTFLSASLMFFAIYYLIAVIYVHKKLFDKYTLFILICFTASLYLFMQLMLSLKFTNQEYLLLHKLKLVFLYLNLPMQLFILYLYFFPSSKRTIPYTFTIMSSIFILLMPTDFIVKDPVNVIVIHSVLGDFTYHFGTTQKGYSIYSIVLFLSYIFALINYWKSKSKTKRIPFVILIICVFIVSINDFAITHGFIQNIMTAEYYIFILIAFIFFEFLKGDRKQYIQIIELNTKLKQLDTAKSYLIGLLSHELRTPLMGINGNAKYIAEITSDPEIKESAEHILLSEARLRKFSELSMLITSIQTDKYQLSFDEENIITILEISLEKIESQLQKKGLKLIKDFKIKEQIFNFDSILMTKVFDIVLDNATKFSPENSVLLIRTNKLYNCLSIEIIDKGKGFLEEDLNSLFEFFSSTGELLNHSEGTGLSLATAKMIMDMHNFEIIAENSPEGGATIKMIF